jgi:hypothetical protein
VATAAGDSCKLEVEWIDGHPRVRTLTWTARLDRPFGYEELKQPLLDRILEAAVASQAFRETDAVYGGGAIYDSGATYAAEVDPEVAASAAAENRYRHNTAEFLAQVLEVYRAGQTEHGRGGGIRAVIDKWHYSDRHARRLVSRARAEFRKQR